MAREGRRALFLDRDGTIVVDTGYLRDPQTVRLVDGVGPALREARALGYALLVVSNQSGIARGLIARSELEAVHARMVELLAAEGVTLDDSFYCVHGPDDACRCRKPAPGLLLQAAQAHAIDLAGSAMIGDKESDVAAGEAAGCASLQLDTWSRATEWLRGRRC
jgi:histidinol-phosphate phosphatase family protein